MSSEETLPKNVRATAPGPGDPIAHLVVAFDCDAPAASAEAFALGGVSEVRLGRGAQREHTHGAAGPEMLVIWLDDPRISSAHARLERGPDGWRVRDEGSRNGTYVNGVRRDVTSLGDGDVIEIGHTMLVFRRRTSGAEQRHTRLAPSAGDRLCTLDPDLAGRFDELARVARAPVPILIRGESGTGKELAAQAVHELSARGGRFVAVNCGALPGTLAAAELFGHRRGAFTGATEDRPGLIRAADAGTLFLDEIGDLPPDLQVTLLRVLQEREVVPVGDTRPVPVDFRLLVATHRDLAAMVEAGAFRADLYARLKSFELQLPPLRDRPEDLGWLIGSLLARLGHDQVHFEPEAARALFLYEWPGNVRELEQYLGSAVALADGEPVRPEHLPPELRDAAEPGEALSPADSSRRDQLIELLTEHRGNVTAVGRALGKSRVQVHRWLKRFDIDAGRFRR